MFYLIILIFSVNQARAIDVSPGNPLPHAELLESMIRSQFSNGSDNNGLIYHYLEGEDFVPDEDDINLNILDISSLRNIIDVLKKRYKDNVTDLQAGSVNASESSAPGPLPPPSANSPKRRQLPHALNDTLYQLLVSKAFLLMQQSIYATRYRLQETNFYRNRFKGEPQYNIALLAGSMDIILMKMDNLLQEMRELWGQTHFIWYLIIYEKILTMNVDVGYIARRIWAIHKEFMGPDENDHEDSNIQDMRPDQGPDSQGPSPPGAGPPGGGAEGGFPPGEGAGGVGFPPGKEAGLRTGGLPMDF